MAATMPLSGVVGGNIIPIYTCLRTNSSCSSLTKTPQRRVQASSKLHYTDYRIKRDSGDDDDEPKQHLYLEESEKPDTIDKESWGKYKVRHRFQGLNPRTLDLDSFPRFRTDFNGQKGKLAWMGVECVKCGMQIRREKRTNKETSLNVYSHDSIPKEFLRSCPERKLYPLLWRSRDPFFVLDILGIDD